MKLNLNIRDKVSPALAGIATAIQQDGLMVAGQAVKELVRENFLKLEQTHPNKMGWPSQHFFAKAYRSVSNPTRQAGGVAIDINQIGIGLLFSGGTVRPGSGISSHTGEPTEKLAIPAREEAYGKKPGEFPSLKVLFGRHGAYALAIADFTPVSFGRRRQDGTRSITHGPEQGGGIMYWLVDEAKIAPHPEVLPTVSEMEMAGVAAYEKLVERKLKEGESDEH